MAEAGQAREPIRMTPVGEREVSRTPFRTGCYEVTVERTFVDQYGHEWRSFHRIFESDREETTPGDGQELPKTDNP